MNQKPVLLTVSGNVPADIETKIADGLRPEADFIAMARAFQADLIDYARARQMTGWFGRWLERMGGPALVLAWACYLVRNQYRLVFTDGEQVGIPLAFLIKFFGFSKRRHLPKHFMITHILSVKKKMLFFDLFNVQTHIDRFFVYSTFQKQFIEERWHVPAERVTFTPFMVDHHFFCAEKTSRSDPLQGWQDSKPLLCSVGLEFRDYPTLIEAVKGLDVRLVIAAASPWSKRKDTTTGQTIPENILVKRYSQYELRDIYASSQMMVMPLYPVAFQAGVTAILEAMSMGKPVICSRTLGQTDVISDGKNGLYVPPQDPDALRRAIVDLLNHPEKAQAVGLASRQSVLETLSLEKYTSRLQQYVEAAVS